MTRRAAVPRTESLSVPIALRIATALENAGWSQSHLARQLAGEGASQTRVNNTRRLLLKWLSGANNPSAEYAEQLSEVFGEDRDYFKAQRAGALELDAFLLVRGAAEKLAKRVPADISGRMGRAQIVSLMPHVHEKQILVDKVISLEPGVRVEAETQRNAATWPLGPFYKGDADLVPGFVLAEALAQAAAIAVLAQGARRDRVVLLASFGAMRFRRIVSADSKLRLHAKVTHVAGHIVHFEVKAVVGSEDVVRGRLTLAID